MSVLIKQFSIFVCIFIIGTSCQNPQDVSKHHDMEKVIQFLKKNDIGIRIGFNDFTPDSEYHFEDVIHAIEEYNSSVHLEGLPDSLNANKINKKRALSFFSILEGQSKSTIEPLRNNFLDLKTTELHLFEGFPVNEADILTGKLTAQKDLDGFLTVALDVQYDQGLMESLYQTALSKMNELNDRILEIETKIPEAKEYSTEHAALLEEKSNLSQQRYSAATICYWNAILRSDLDLENEELTKQLEESEKAFNEYMELPMSGMPDF